MVEWFTRPGVSREHRVLGVIIVAALAARLWAVGFGLPHYIHPDEPRIVDHAKQIVDTRDPNPHWFIYPPLYLYLETIVLGVTRAVATSRTPAPSDEELRTIVYVAGRATTAVVGAATALVAYLAGRRLWGPVAGLAAATVLALAFGHVQQSQYIKVDVPAGFWSAVCLWLAAVGVTGGGRRWLIASGAAAGLAAATKYNAGLCIIAPLALWLTLRRDRSTLDLATPVWIGLAAALALVVVMPWMVLDHADVLRDMQSEVVHYRTGQFGAEGSDSGRFYLAYLWNEGLTPPLALLVVLGWLLLLWREPRRWVALTAFPLCYLLLLASMRLRFARNLMPAMAPLALFAGYAGGLAIAWLAARRTPPVVVTAAIALVLVWPVARIAIYDHYMVQPDTFRHAATWLTAHEPAGTTICTEIFPRDLWDPRFTIVEVGALPTRALSFYPERGCGLVVAVSYMYRPALRDPELYPERAAFYREVFTRWPLEAEFRYSDSRLVTALAGEEFEVYDPVIRVHRVPAAANS